MISEHERFAHFQKMVRESTDPLYIRVTFDRPHQYSALRIVGIATLGLILVLACSVVW